ncbi:CBS domain-containing protein [Candidatus Sumerlaeota bacterium]|nr:CBS domain-containing protein [Candidatus Sumerlaeota bacterium]
MLPGFPMDGGRVLRAAIWSISGQYERATRVAAGGGSLIAYFFIALGIYMAFFKRDWIDGLWIAFIGMFLLTAARSAIVQLATRRAFVARHVIDIMEHVPYCVSPAMSVRALVDGPILQHGLITFVVEDAGTLRGMVTLNDVKAVPREEWDSTPLQSVMIPAQDLVALRALDSLQRAMELMDERGIHQAPVVEGDRVIGIVTRDGLLRILRTELEFGPR